METTGSFAEQSTDHHLSYIDTLDLIFKNCPDGIAFKDKNLVYRYANEAFYKLCKISNPTDIIGKITPPNISNSNQKLLQGINTVVFQEQRAVNFTMIIEEKSAPDRILNITSSPISKNNDFYGIISIVKDITNEEHIKESFVSKHFRLKSFFENIPMLIYVQDKHQNYISGTKPAYSFIKDGYDAFTNINIDWSKNITLEKEDNLDVINNCKTLVKEVQYTGFRRNSHWYKVYKAPICDSEGSVSGIITVTYNIDSEKQLQAQRETFVASLGHDLKSPIIAQSLNLELLLEGKFGELSYDQKVLIGMILDSCRYMNGMLSTLLATYRNFDGVSKLQFAEFSFTELVMECVTEMIYVAKDKEVEISVDLKHNADFINADRMQLKRVIMNLLSNGIKYAYKNSILDLKVFNKHGKTCFEFENSSPYIPPTKQKSIFAQYVTFASAHKELGIGLGLYTSQKIIEAHNGTIYVHSSKDNKNTFGFKIPTKPIYTDMSF